MRESSAPLRSRGLLFRLRERLLSALRVLGHFQAQFLLTVLFFLVVTPYGLLLRLFRARLGYGAAWHPADRSGGSLARLRKTF